jgi:hypothetical protein
MVLLSEEMVPRVQRPAPCSKPALSNVVLRPRWKTLKIDVTTELRNLLMTKVSELPQELVDIVLLQLEGSEKLSHP